MIAALGLHGAAAEQRQHRSMHRRSRNPRKAHRKEAAGSNATAAQHPDSGSNASAIQAEKTDNKIGPTGPTGLMGAAPVLPDQPAPPVKSPGQRGQWDRQGPRDCPQ